MAGQVLAVVLVALVLLAIASWRVWEDVTRRRREGQAPDTDLWSRWMGRGPRV